MKKLFNLFVLFLFFAATISAQTFDYKNVCLTSDEQKLAGLINAFRKENKKSTLPLSKALTIVAKAHVTDLQENRPDTSICLTGSWSDNADWTPCCYNKYVLNEECMWGKPKELTDYPYRGYELSYFEEGIIQVDSLFNIWMTSEETKDMLLTQGNFSPKKWETMGLAVGENYACIWFGQRTDAAGSPPACETLQPKNQENENKPVASGKQQSYYLIYGSFILQADAEEAVKRYNKNGFTNAQILQAGQRFRVALNKFASLKAAMDAKEKLSSSYREAWILKE